jgi:hypothetical protein
MKQSKKRTLLMVLLLLTGGAIINVAVAWVCCMNGADDSRFARRTITDADMEWRTRHAPGGILEAMDARQHNSLGYAEVRLRCHGPVVRLYESRSEILSGACWTEAGLPCRSVRGEWFLIPDAANGLVNVETRGAYRLQLKSTGNPVTFPESPIWPGFAINTMFYAAVLWVLLALPGAVRRFVRRRRGRCTRCGYDLRGQVAAPGWKGKIVCPECGTIA